MHLFNRNGTINTSDNYLAMHLKTQNYSLSSICILLAFSVGSGHNFAFIGLCLHFFVLGQAVTSATNTHKALILHLL